MTLLAGSDFVSDRSGSQLYVSEHGDPVLDVAVGFSGEGRETKTTDRMTWMCCSKPVLLVALCRALADAGTDEHAPVARFIPEFATAGKDDVTLAHLLTHTVPYKSLGMNWSDDDRQDDNGERDVLCSSWADALKVICEMPLSGEPGERVTYTAETSWHVLAEVLQRLAGRPHEEYVAELVLAPLGMSRTSMYLTEQDMAAADLAPMVVLDEVGAPRVHDIDTPPWVFSRWPGLSCRGPARDMIAAIECVAGWRRAECVDPAWRARLLEPRRFDLSDPIFDGSEVIWSLGLCVDPVPYGLPLSRRVAGYTGMRSSLVVADLDTGVAISFLSSAMVPKLKDWTRKHLLVRAIYDDLGLPLESPRRARAT